MKARNVILVAVLGSLSQPLSGCGPSGATPDAGAPPTTVDAGPPACDPAKCATSNVCVQNRCMLTCARHTNCPGGYDCLEVEEQRVCVANNLPTGKGYFGYSCGINADKDCKGDEGFVCVGIKGDPSSYCARSPCAGDQDCPGDYYCADADVSMGKTRKVCVKRGYCAPAKSLTDCSDPDALFAKDGKGNGFCSRGCNPSAKENPCGAADECLKVGGVGQCWPRSRSCVSTKTYCSRCVSRLDCPSGAACAVNDFTHEKFCTLPCATASCPMSAGGVPGVCAKEYPGKEWGNQCIPDNGDLRPGCWFKK